MDLVLCHRTADFDALGAAVGLARLQPGMRIVLTGGAHPAVRDFLALYRDEYPLMERRSVNPEQIRAIAVVDTQRRELLGQAAAWLDQPGIAIQVYDHHLGLESDIPATQVQVEAVGATTTLIAEHLQQRQVALTVPEATVMALGIHVDTGSLTYEQATARDAAAIAWLMTQGANQRAIATYVEPGLSAKLQTLLRQGLDQIQTEQVQGYQVSWVILSTPRYTPGMSHLASHLMALTESDCLLLGAFYGAKGRGHRLTVIGRSGATGVDLNQLFRPLGGGGHARAAALTLRTEAPEAVLRELFEQLKTQIPSALTARALMSSPVRTIRPETTVNQARRILLRYGHSGLSVVDAQGQLVGIISRRDLDIALHHGFGHAPVKGYMTAPVRTIAPDTPLPEIQALMVTYDMGRLPVLDQDQLVGIVTRTDVLRQLHQTQRPARSPEPGLIRTPIQTRLETLVSPPLQQVLTTAATAAAQRGWQLYLVGGAVRDLLLADPSHPAHFREFDLVVDGVDHPPVEGAGVVLARALQASYPETQLQVHGQFQTAALLWPHQSALGTFSVDIATARTEFYPYPAANPEVAASSIRQDLYRRDFTINALAVRLTQLGPGRSGAGELLDFFGGLLDLQQGQIRVLHPNSFIEDPTRIFRAVRFAVRLGFRLYPQTETYIRHAIASGIYQRIQAENGKAPALQSRLKNELKYMLCLPRWFAALDLLADLGALACVHAQLAWTAQLRRQLRLADRWLDLFDPEATTINRWELRLEVLLAALPPVARVEVGENLHLSAGSLERLRSLAQVSATLTEHLAQSLPPSGVVQQLQPYDLPLLILVALQSPPWLRRQLWQYLNQWAEVKPLLKGDDLKRLGYKPGPQFKLILAALLAATLDGVVQDRATAEAFVRDRFPLP